MSNPYEPPNSGNQRSYETPKRSSAPPLIGCGIGGYLIPFLLFMTSAIIYNDTGGPLIWPIIAIPLGILGLVLGYVYRAAKR